MAHEYARSQKLVEILGKLELFDKALSVNGAVRL